MEHLGEGKSASGALQDDGIDEVASPISLIPVGMEPRPKNHTQMLAVRSSVAEI